jgi:hypothetical protein
MDLTDSALKQISYLPNLVEIHLERCKHMSPVGIEQIAKMPPLRSLDLRGMTQLTDHDLAFVFACKNPIYLSLQDTNISDEGMKTIARSRIYYLDIANAKKISNRGLMMLAAAKQLKGIRLTVASQITESGITEFKRIRPDITIKKESELGSMFKL